MTQTVQLTSSGSQFAFQVETFGVPPWLSVTPTSGTTPATLAVTVNPSGRQWDVCSTANVPVNGNVPGIGLSVRIQVGPAPLAVPFLNSRRRQGSCCRFMGETSRIRRSRARLHSRRSLEVLA